MKCIGLCAGCDDGACRGRLAAFREVVETEDRAEHGMRLAALLAEATRTPGRRSYVTPAGHRMELRPGQRYDPFTPLPAAELEELLSRCPAAPEPPP